MKLNRAKRCECGCGTTVKPGNKFITGHNSKGQNHPMYGKRKIKPPPQECACGCGEMANPGKKYIKGHYNKYHKPYSNKPKPELQLCECGCGKEAPLGNRFINLHQNRGSNNPMYGKTGELCPFYGVERPDISERLQGAGNHMYGRIGELAPMYGKTRELAPMYGRIRSPEECLGTSIGLKKKWANPEYREKQLRLLYQNMKITPNKPESFLFQLLNTLFPKQWEYTGDRSLWINNCNPDFTNYNQRLLIELFGDYWHRNDNPQDRIDKFALCGWDSLIIWGHELEDVTGVIYKINNFVKSNAAQLAFDIYEQMADDKKDKEEAPAPAPKEPPIPEPKNLNGQRFLNRKPA